MGRVAYMFFVIFWSIMMSVLWKLDAAYAWAFVVYSFLCGASVILFRSAKAEQINYKLFQVCPTLILISQNTDYVPFTELTVLEVSHLYNTRILSLHG